MELLAQWYPKINAFEAKLKPYDEQFRILRENGKKEKKHRSTVDAVAAALILEGYLGSL